MLSKVSEIVRNHLDAIDAAKEELKRVEKKTEQYLPNVRQEMYRKEEDRLKKTLSEQLEQAINDINDEFNEILSTIREIVSTPVPANALTTIEMMKMRKIVTEFEVKSILGAFKNNYLASITIYEYFDVEHKIWGKDLYIPRADDLEERVNLTYGDIIRVLKEMSAFHENTAISFTAAVYYNGDVIKGLEADVLAFITRFKD